MPKGFTIPIVPAVVVVLILAVGGIFYLNKSNISKVLPPTPQPNCQTCVDSQDTSCPGNHTCVVPAGSSKGVCVPVPKPSQKYTITQINSMCGTNFSDDETANWKTYKNENITFKFPPNWSEKPEIVNGSRFTKEFKDPEANFAFSFSSDRNYNQSTGKPYSTIDEFVGMSYKVKTVVVDGQDGRQPLPRAGNENVILVDFFSKDSKIIYTLDLKAGDTSLNTPEADVEKGQKLFDQILSTFKFLP